MKMVSKMHILLLFFLTYVGGGTVTRSEHVVYSHRAQNYMVHIINQILTVYVTPLLVVLALSLSSVVRRAKHDKHSSSKQLTTAELKLQLAKLKQKVAQLEDENSSLETEKFSLKQKNSLLSKENTQLKKKATIAGREKIHFKSLLKKHQDSPLYLKQLTNGYEEGSEKSIAIQIEPDQIRRKTKHVTFAPHMVLERVCHFDDSGLLRDILPTRKTKLSV